MAEPSETENETGKQETFTMVIRMVFVSLTILGNALILCVIRKPSNFKTITRYLIGHLAVIDILFGLSVGVTAFLVLADAMTYQACLIVTASLVANGFCSCVGICLVFLDNFLSVRTLASTAREGLSMKNTGICILVELIAALIYSLAFVLSAPPDITIDSCIIGGPAYTRGAMISVMVVVFVTMLIMIVLMMSTLHVIKARMNDWFQPLQDGSASDVQDVMRQTMLKKRSKITRLFTIITVGFIISWCPMAVGVLFATMCPQCNVSNETLRLLSSFPALNACCNVVVYAIKDAKFRSHAVKILKCQGNQITNDTMVVTLS